MSATRSPQAAVEAVNGSPRYKGTISATGTVATLAVSANTMYILQPDGDCYIHGASTSGGTIIKQDASTATLTTSLGLLVAGGDTWLLTTRPDETYIAAITSGTSVSVKVFTLES